MIRSSGNDRRIERDARIPGPKVCGQMPVPACNLQSERRRHSGAPAFVMKVGIVHRGARLAISDPEFRLTVFNFSVGSRGPSKLRMLHAAAASPARYLMEMARRMASIRHQGGSIVLFNPLLELNVAEIGVALRHLVRAESSGECVVAHSGDGTPVAYMLPTLSPDGLVGLSLLSTSEAQTDCELIGQFHGGTVRAQELPFEAMAHRVGNGFYAGEERRRIYSWLARRACVEYRNRSGTHGVPPIAAILPFHAGDVLFMCLAIQRCNGYCRAIVVDRRYRAIVEAVAPDLFCIQVDFSGGRSTTEDWDQALIELIQGECLPSGYLYVYCRPSRAYDALPIHLMDQYAFAVGDSCEGDSIVSAHRRSHIQVQRDRRRVLLYVDGGWPLKVYPIHMQKSLIDLLTGSGFEITVMSASEQPTVHGCPNIRFSGLAQLHELLVDLDLVIGMDSFPTHYAIHVLGIPTICLFSSTAPENSDAGSAVHYRALEAGLKCRPCRGVATCPQYGGEVCRNFVAPRDIVSAAVKLTSPKNG